MQLPIFTAPLLSLLSLLSLSLRFSFLTLHSPSTTTLCSHVHKAGLALCPPSCTCQWWEYSCRVRDSVCERSALATQSDALDLNGPGIQWFICCCGTRHTRPHGFDQIQMVQTWKVCNNTLGQRKESTYFDIGLFTLLLFYFAKQSLYFHSFALITWQYMYAENL